MMSSECEEGCIETEIEALKSIYVHELEVEYGESDQPTRVTVHLHPATGEDTEKQFVRLTLVLKLSSRYPEEIPTINIRNPRGLSDDKLELLFQNLTLKAEESKGHQSIYELIEVAKEHLTVQNTPSCPCAICLYHFTEEDVFTKTECYHYFHCYCLSCYIHHCLAEQKEEISSSRGDVENEKIEIICPVCRAHIDYTVFAGKTFPVPKESEEEQYFKITPDLRKQQEWMAFLFEKQRAKGSIIDVEMEKRKLFLEISATSTEGVNNSATLHSNLTQNSLEIEEPNVSAATGSVSEEETLQLCKNKREAWKPTNSKARKLENSTKAKKIANSTFYSNRKTQCSVGGSKTVLSAINGGNQAGGCPDVEIDKYGSVEQVCGEHHSRKKTYERFWRSGAQEPRNWYSKEKYARVPSEGKGFSYPAIQIKSYNSSKNCNVPSKGYPSNDCSAKADGKSHNNNQKPLQNKCMEDCQPTSNTVKVNISQNNEKFEDASQQKKMFNNKVFNYRVRNFDPHRARFGYELHFNRHKNKYPPPVYGSRNIPEEKPDRKQFQRHQDISLDSDKSMNLTEKDTKNEKEIKSTNSNCCNQVNSRTIPLSQTIVQPYTRGFKPPPGFSGLPPGFER